MNFGPVGWLTFVGYSVSMKEKFLKHYFVLSCDSTVSMEACTMVTNLKKKVGLPLLDNILVFLPFLTFSYI